MGKRGNSVPGLCGAGVKSGSRLKKKKTRENFSQEEKEEAETKREEFVFGISPSCKH
jgi:hypothetical protein